MCPLWRDQSWGGISQAGLFTPTSKQNIKDVLLCRSAVCAGPLKSRARQLKSTKMAESAGAPATWLLTRTDDRLPVAARQVCAAERMKDGLIECAPRFIFFISTKNFMAEAERVSYYTGR